MLADTLINQYFMDSIIEIFIHAAHASEAVTDKASGIGSLGLNVKLFAAQLVNFAVIFFVLWRWVFKPITRHLQERTSKIEQSLQDAEDIQRQKAEFDEWRVEEMSKTREETSEMVKKAKLEAELVRTDILTKAKSEEDKLRTEGLALLERQRQAILQESKTELAELVVSATEKVLHEKLTDEKDLELARRAVKSLSK